MQAHQLDDGRTYKDLMAALDEALTERPYTTRELKEKFPEWPEWQVDNCLGYVGAVKVPGDNRMDPWTVYGRDYPGRPVPQVDTDILDYFAAHGDPVDASDLKAHLLDGLGYGQPTVDQAYNRLGVTAKKSGRKWVRTRTVAKPKAAARKYPGASALYGTHPLRAVLVALADAPSTIVDLANDLYAKYPVPPLDVDWKATRETLAWAVEACVELKFAVASEAPVTYTVTDAGLDHLAEYTDWKTLR